MKDVNFMGVMESVMRGVWDIFDHDLHFPEPLGTIDMKTIVLFFACCIIIANLIRAVSERRD